MSDNPLIIYLTKSNASNGIVIFLFVFFFSLHTYQYKENNGEILYIYTSICKVSRKKKLVSTSEEKKQCEIIEQNIY
jgi:hypothetical protein